eukprot:TRINITY_DN11768_c0_g1_i5.p1 TRINITY_DN11768_c0_g1~~TRINITY_DN11768_c0_g1_i5.p1  ORF type:complete len:165 (-),score=14.14 TRINITY_DN11768_c0_g1_i5:132-626(-)
MSMNYVTRSNCPLHLPEVANTKERLRKVHTKVQTGTLTPILDRADTDFISNENKIVLYKKAHQLGGENYIVEVSKLVEDNGKMSVIAHSLLGDKKYYLPISGEVCKNAEVTPEAVAKNVVLRRDKLSLIPFWRSKTSIKNYSGARSKASIKRLNAQIYNTISHN